MAADLNPIDKAKYVAAKRARKGKKGEGWKYENQPWEKEAYKLEKELFMECFPHMAKFTN